MNRARRLAGQAGTGRTRLRRAATRGAASVAVLSGHSASAAAFAVARLVALLAVRPAALTVYRGRDSRR